MQSHVYTIDNRDKIADRDMVADAGAAADSDPGCGPTQRFQAKSACLYQFFSAENCTVIPFQVFSNYGGNEKDQVPDRPP